MTFKKSILSAALFSLISSSAIAGPLSANVSLTSDYLWRGMTQASNEASVQGGADYDMGNGVAVGIWAATLKSPLDREIDLYASYAGKMGDLDYSAGIVYYNYAVSASSFTDVNFYVNKDEFSAGFIQDITNSLSTIDLGYSTSMSEVDLAVNIYIPTASGSTTTFQLSAGKEFSGVGVSAIIGNDGTSTAVGISATKSFDL